MSELSRDEVIAELGPLSDAVVAEIIATGIEKADLAKVKSRFLADSKDGTMEALDTDPIGLVIGILERVAWEPGQGLFGEAGSRLR